MFLVVSDFKLFGLGGPAVKFDLGKVIDAGGNGACRVGILKLDLGKVIDAGGNGACRVGILKLAVTPDLFSGGAGGAKVGKSDLGGLGSVIDLGSCLGHPGSGFIGFDGTTGAGLVGINGGGGGGGGAGIVGPRSIISNSCTCIGKD